MRKTIPTFARTHTRRRTRARTLQPPTQLYHARTCAAAPQAACYAEAACRSAHKMRLSQARFECLPIFPPCLSQTGRESSKHCNRVPPHMKTQCAALTGSVGRCFHTWAGKRKRGPWRGPLYFTHGLRGPCLFKISYFRVPKLAGNLDGNSAIRIAIRRQFPAIRSPFRQFACFLKGRK